MMVIIITTTSPALLMVLVEPLPQTERPGPRTAPSKQRQTLTKD